MALFEWYKYKKWDYDGIKISREDLIILICCASWEIITLGSDEHEIDDFSFKRSQIGQLPNAYP